MLPSKIGSILALALPFALTACGVRPPVVPTVTSDASAGRPSLTIYSSADPSTFLPGGIEEYGYDDSRTSIPGFGVVREARKVPLVAGRNRVELTRIAKGIDPTTVTFRSLTDMAGTAVLEQNLEFDLVGPRKMLQRFLGRDVVLTIAGKNEESTDLPCTLLSLPDENIQDPAYVVRAGGANGPITVQQAAQVRAIRLPEAGGAVVSKPTLNWLVQATKPGPHDVEIGYQTDGMSWRADYNLLLAPDEKSAEASAWVSIVNRSGLSYEHTSLKLIAGKVRRVTYSGSPRSIFTSDLNAASSNFREQPFSDYHLYTLPQTTTLPDNSTKQVELFPVRQNIGVEKRYIWTGPNESQRNRTDGAPFGIGGTAEPGDVKIVLQLKNTEAGGLGLPLPAGRVRCYKVDPSDGSRQFIGEDAIDHTPTGEPLDLFIGVAFDVVGSRTRTSALEEEKSRIESYEVSIRNRKKEPAQVIVRESLYRDKTATLTESSQKPSAKTARAVEFLVDLAAGEEKKVTYTVKYTW